MQFSGEFYGETYGSSVTVSLDSFDGTHRRAPCYWPTSLLAPKTCIHNRTQPTGLDTRGVDNGIGSQQFDGLRTPQNYGLSQVMVLGPSGFRRAVNTDRVMK